MEQFFQGLEETMNSGDQEIRTWFLVKQNYLPFILCGSYILFSTIIGPAIMKNRKPFSLRTPMVIFNFCLVAIYTTTLSLVAWTLPKMPWEQFCVSVIVKKGSVTYELASYAWVVYILKYVEFFDTVFFVLRKKQNLITFLHVMHHTVVPLFGWFIFRTEKSGFQSIPVIINSVVHVFMYTYYGLAALGPKFRKYLWWKKYLTQMQIVQFCLVIIFVVAIVPLSGCTMVSASYLADLTLGPMFLYLFYTFYVNSFHRTQKASVTDDVAKKESLSNGDVIKNGEEKRRVVANGTTDKEK